MCHKKQTPTNKKAQKSNGMDGAGKLEEEEKKEKEINTEDVEMENTNKNKKDWDYASDQTITRTNIGSKSDDKELDFVQ